MHKKGKLIETYLGIFLRCYCILKLPLKQENKLRPHVRCELHGDPSLKMSNNRCWRTYIRKTSSFFRQTTQQVTQSAVSHLRCHLQRRQTAKKQRIRCIFWPWSSFKCPDYVPIKPMVCSLFINPGLVAPLHFGWTGASWWVWLTTGEQRGLRKQDSTKVDWQNSKYLWKDPSDGYTLL